MKASTWPDVCIRQSEVPESGGSLLQAQYPVAVSCCVARSSALTYRALLPIAILLLPLPLCPLQATRRDWKESVFSTYHVALSLAMVTVGASVGLEVGGNGALGGHCVWMCG
jgi:hypothetical protein